MTSTGFTGGYSYSSPSHLVQRWKISPLRGFINKGTVPLQRFRRYAAELDPNVIVSSAEQSEAITTPQIVTSVLILSLAQPTESQALTSNSSNTTKQPLQRKSVFPLVEIGVIGNTFNTFGVVEL